MKDARPVAEEAVLNDLNDEVGCLPLSHIGAESMPIRKGKIKQKSHTFSETSCGHYSRETNRLL